MPLTLFRRPQTNDLLRTTATSAAIDGGISRRCCLEGMRDWG